MTIWRRYLFRRLLFSLAAIFLCLLTLYIAIDFSINGVRFLSKETTSWLDICINYLRHLAKFFDLFASISFLLASLKTLLDLNHHRELVALQIGGISAKKLLSPFFAVAALLTALSYANSQWVAPDAQMAATHFHQAHSKKKSKLKKHIFSIDLQDGSELVYQSYDPKTKELFDVFWIKAADDLWYIKYLGVGKEPFQGRFADHFVRDGILQKVASEESRLFPEIQWDEIASLQKIIPLENRSLSLLLQQTLSCGSEKQKSAAHLHYKLALPCLPFLILLSIAPVSFRFSRGRSSFLLIGVSFFAFAALHTFLDAMLILAENQVFSPLTIIWGPMALCFAIASFFFSRL